MSAFKCNANGESQTWSNGIRVKEHPSGHHQIMVKQLVKHN